MKNIDHRILVDLSRYQTSSFEEIPVEFELLDEEKKTFPNLISLDELVLSAKITSASDYYTISLALKGSARVRDAHNGVERTLPFDDDFDLVIAPHDEESSDILPDEDGQYDLRGSILALLYDAIPDSYSEVPLTEVKTDDFVLMSEEEYAKKQAKKNNPFAALNEEEEEK